MKYKFVFGQVDFDTRADNKTEITVYFDTFANFDADVILVYTCVNDDRLDIFNFSVEHAEIRLKDTTSQATTKELQRISTKVFNDIHIEHLIQTIGDYLVPILHTMPLNFNIKDRVQVRKCNTERSKVRFTLDLPVEV